MRTLWISPRWPFPADTGAKKATYSLLKALPEVAREQKQDLIIDLVSLYEEGDELEPFKDQWAQLFPNGRTLFLKKAKAPLGVNGLSFILESIRNPALPFTVARCASAAQVRSFQDWSQGQIWDFTVLDGLHGVAFLTDFQSSQFGQWIYRSHNVETELWSQLRSAVQNPLKRWALRREEKRCYEIEKELCNRSHRVLTVSEDDVRKYKALSITDKAQSLPIGFSIPSTPLPGNFYSPPQRLLFVGRLDWIPNVQGLKWFLEKVWPSLEDRYHLDIVGSGESQWLEAYRQDRVEIHRNVPDLEPFYQASDLTLIPLLMGSGTRVKAIEAAAYGRTFLSTRVGAEGLLFSSSEDYYEAESAADWIHILQGLTSSDLQQKSRSLFVKAQDHYSEEALARRFLDII